MELEKIYSEIKKCVIECGEILINADRDDLNINKKEGCNNIVTKYDILIQNKLKNDLLNIIPNAGFIGEENDSIDNINNEYVFVVDPIDGTTNFSRNFKICAISVALLKNKEPFFGFCYNPYMNELYESKKGNGSFLNGKKIHVSNKKLKDGLVLCGLAPYYEELRAKSLEIQNNFILNSSDYRRMGSAVLAICDVASGRAELYFELNLKPWDFAAASLILEEAGGVITTIDGNKIDYTDSSSVLVSNNKEDYFKYIER